MTHNGKHDWVKAWFFIVLGALVVASGVFVAVVTGVVS